MYATHFHARFTQQLLSLLSKVEPYVLKRGQIVTSYAKFV